MMPAARRNLFAGLGVVCGMPLGDDMEIRRNIEQAYPLTRKTRLTYSGNGYGAGYAEGQKADIGVSDVFYGSCSAVAPAMPATLKDFPGPVQAMEFVVAKSNTGTAYLTAAEANIIYGCGAPGGIASFTQALTVAMSSSDRRGSLM